MTEKLSPCTTLVKYFPPLDIPGLIIDTFKPAGMGLKTNHDILIMIPKDIPEPPLESRYLQRQKERAQIS